MATIRILAMRETLYGHDWKDTRNQHLFHLQNETVGQFVTELRAIARYCNFKDTLNEALRDRIVCGINDDAVQRRLLAVKKLDLPKALDIGTRMETAKHNLKELHESTTAKRHDTAVFKVRSESTSCPEIAMLLDVK